MESLPRAIEYANAATCRAWRYRRELTPLEAAIPDVEGISDRQLLPDGVILIVGSDMSVALEWIDPAPMIDVGAMVGERAKDVNRRKLALELSGPEPQMPRAQQ